MDMRLTGAAHITGIPYGTLYRWAHAGIIETTQLDPAYIDETVVEVLKTLFADHNGNSTQTITEYRLRREQLIPHYRAATVIGVTRQTVSTWCANGLVPGVTGRTYGEYLIPTALVIEWAHTNAQYSTASTKRQFGVSLADLARIRQNGWLRSSTLPNNRRFYQRPDVDFLTGLLKKWPKLRVTSILYAAENVLSTLEEDEDKVAETRTEYYEAARKLRDKTPPELLTILLRRRHEMIAERTNLG